MEKAHSGLFAFHLASLATSSPKAEPAGTYDPAEQLWKDEGSLLSCTDPQGYASCYSECIRYESAASCRSFCCTYG